MYAAVSLCNPVFYTQNGRTPLMTASLAGHVDVVSILSEDKTQMNTQTVV